MCDRDCKEALDRWLDTATDSLCDVAKQRVDNEIRAHYAEAVETEVGQGQSANEAHRVAVESLGDSHEAGRTFRRTYLTAKEAKGFAALAHPPESTRRFRRAGKRLAAVCFFVVLALFSFGLLLGFPDDGHYAVCLFSFLVSNFIVLWLCPSLAMHSRWRACIVWSIVGALLLFAASLRILWWQTFELLPSGWVSSSQRTVLASFLLLAFLCTTVFLVSHTTALLRKLGKHTNLYDSFLSGDNGGRHA